MQENEMSSTNQIKNSIVNRAFIEAVCGAFLLCGVGFIIQWRYGFGWSDEGLLWYASQRTFLGEVPILDFYSYDPGRYYWVSLFFHLTGNTGLFSLLAAGAAFGATGLASIWYAMVKADVPWKIRLTCASLIVVALGFPRHKVYEQSLSLILCALIFFTLTNINNARQWFIFGFATGIAAFIGRNHGVFFATSFILVALYMLLSKRRNLLPSSTAWFVTGVVAGYSPMLTMIAFQPGFLEALIHSLLGTSNWQLPLPIPFIWVADLSGKFSVDLIQTIAIGMASILIPMIYILGIYLLLSKKQGETTYKIVTLMGGCCIAGIPYMHQAFQRADFSHIAQATLPSIPAVISLAYYLALQHKKNISILLLITTFTAVVACWLPAEPAVKYWRLFRAEPPAVSAVDISGKKFYVDNYQAAVISAVRQAVQKCNIEKNEILAAPHFPGIYALLGAKAPFWEMYYLYKRPDDFQQSHIRAISNTKLVVLSQEATIDGLESLKLRNTNSLLVDYINQTFRALKIKDSPNGIQLLIKDGTCIAKSETTEQ